MDRAKILSALIIVAAVLVAVHWSGGRAASAESQYSRHISVLLVDGQAVRLADGGVDLASSFMGVMSALRDDQLFMFMSADGASQTLGPYRATDAEYPQIRESILANLKGPATAYGNDLAEALIEAKTALNDERAAPGSDVYLITGDSRGTDFERLSVQLSPLADRFVDSGWRLNGVSLAGASPEARAFLEGISADTGGVSFQLSGTNGLIDLADVLLGQGARGSLGELGTRKLVSTELMSSVISVVPGTSEATVLVFRENGEGYIRLSNPTGFDASPFNDANTRVVETANAIIWQLKDPVPGNWKMDVRGMRGAVSAWEHSTNDYSLVLVPTAPVPLGQPTTLLAHVEEGERVVVLDDVRLFANITTPGGARVVIEMRDDGGEGDAVANDGSYAMTLAPLGAEGDYGVELELVWLEFNHRLSALTRFEARVYPQLSVETVDVGNLEPGERAQVAYLSVHVGGEPYPVAPEQVTAVLNSTVGSEAQVEVVPRRVYGDGPAFEYDVFLTALDHGRYSLAYRLSTEYAGRLFDHTTDTTNIASEPPQAPAPVEELASVVAPPEAAVEAARVTAPAPAPAPGPSPSSAFDPSGFSWVFVWIPIVGIAIAGAAAAFMATRSRPYGYIYGDDEPLVDFAEIRRHPILGLFTRGSVSGKDVGIPGLEGVIFRFARNKIRLSSRSDQPTVRVNNQPLVGQATIENRTWIGVGGKLYTFLVSPLPTHEAAGAD